MSMEINVSCKRIVLGHIFSITRDGDGFIWEEECDNYFSEKMSKAESIELVERLRAFLYPITPD